MNTQQLHPTVADCAAILEAWAPPAWAEPWDNVGLLVGDPTGTVRRILVALEVTDAVLAEARQAGAELLLVHHPPILAPLRAVRTDQAAGARIARLLRDGISVYAAHTNLDVAPDGTNDTLAALCGLREAAVLQPSGGAAAAAGGEGAVVRGHGRIGPLAEPVTLSRLAERVRVALGVPALRVAGDPERVITVAAVGAGAGSDLMAPAAARGAQVLITGDIKHHQAQDALDLGLAVIDPGHYATEAPALPAVVRRLETGLATRGWAATVQLSRRGSDPLTVQA